MRNHRRLLLTTLCAVLLGVLILQSAPAGKGGGGGGGGGEPVPFTYQIQWLPPGFRGIAFNDQYDVVGSLLVDQPDGQTSSTDTLFHEGVLYDINALVNDSNWLVGAANAISNRKDGIFYVVGLGLHNGNRRGFRLALFESENGSPPVVLEMLNVGVLTGDIQSQSGAVNSYGDVAGISRSANGVDQPFLYTDETAIVAINANLKIVDGASSLKLNEGGVMVGNYEDAITGESRMFRWDAIGGLQTWGDSRRVHEINNYGEMAGQIAVEVVKRGKTSFKYPAWVHDGTSFVDFPELAGNGINGFNDIGDLTLYPTTIYLADLDKAYDVLTMIDPENSLDDLATLGSKDRVQITDLNNSGGILGSGQVYHYEGKVLVSEHTQSFILIPILQP